MVSTSWPASSAPLRNCSERMSEFPFFLGLAEIIKTLLIVVCFLIVFFPSLIRKRKRFLENPSASICSRYSFAKLQKICKITCNHYAIIFLPFRRIIPRVSASIALFVTPPMIILIFIPLWAKSCAAISSKTKIENILFNLIIPWKTFPFCRMESPSSRRRHRGRNARHWGWWAITSHQSSFSYFLIRDFPIPF